LATEELKTVAPVVVSPEIDSKYASASVRSYTISGSPSLLAMSPAIT